MSKQNKPKFRIGDTIVVTIYGTVGKITDIKKIDGEYLYEVNESEGLFKEKVLELLDTYEGYVFEQEQIDIEYKYLFGDLVIVRGYENDLFKVVGFRTEIWRYKEDAWEDVIYELMRISDGEWLEANEEELTLIADVEQADAFIHKYGLVFPGKNEAKPVLQHSLSNNQMVWIDQLLDSYNDNKVLYQLFSDEKYLRKMEYIIEQLRQQTIHIVKEKE